MSKNTTTTTASSDDGLLFAAAEEDHLLAAKQSVFHEVEQQPVDNNEAPAAVFADVEQQPVKKERLAVQTNDNHDIAARMTEEFLVHVGIFEDETPNKEESRVVRNETMSPQETAVPQPSLVYTHAQRPVSHPGAFRISLSGPTAGNSNERQQPAEDPEQGQQPVHDTLAEARPVVLPTETAEPVDLSRQNQETDKTQKRVKLFGLFLFIVAMTASLATTLVILLAGKHDKGSENEDITIAPTTDASEDFWVWNLPFNVPDDTLQKLEKDIDHTSAASRAFEWIKNDPFLESYSKEQGLQRYVMAIFYYVTNGADWINTGDTVATVGVEVPDDLNVNYKKRGSQRHLEIGRNEAWNPQRQLQPPGGLCVFFIPNPGGIQNVDISSEPWLSYSNDSKSECDWFSTATIVSTSACQLDNKLVSLDLEFNGLRGALPEELFLLDSLETLNFQKNAISGAISPDIERLTNLKYVSFYHNSLTGTIPPQVSLLSNLWNFDVADNSLSGSLPSELWTMSTLEFLHVGNNRLTGSIHPDIGHLLPNLITLRNRMNQMTGTIPTSLGLLSNLFAIGSWDNSFSGSLPTELGNLTKMKWLLTQRNLLTGALPSELGRLPLLRQIKVTGNVGISGTLPTELSLLNQTLTGLDIKGTSIIGTIPDGLCGILCLSFDCSPTLCGCGCPCGNSTL